MTAHVMAGAARVNLDPPPGLPLMGRCRLGGIMTDAMNATGSFTPLCARCLMLRINGQVATICSVDVCVIGRESVERIRAAVAPLLGHNGELIVVATHTHSAPPGWKEFGFTDARAEAWLEQLEKRIADAVRQAHDQLEPATLSLGRTQVPDLTANRRLRMPDGHIDMNFLVPDPRVGEPVGPVDPELIVLQVHHRSGAPRALLANFACHSNILLETEHLDYCAEPFVIAMLQLERRHPEFVGLHLPGAMGDVNLFSRPLDRCHAQEQRIADHYRQSLQESFAHAETITPQPLSIEQRCVNVSLRPLPSTDRLRSEIDEQLNALRNAERRADRDATWKLKRTISHREALLDHIAHHTTARTASLPYKLVRIGPLYLVTCPGELFVEFGLRIKQAAPTDACMIVGYADDYHGYFPTRAAFEQGGYEPTPSIYSLTAEDAGERYLTDVLAALKREE